MLKPHPKKAPDDDDRILPLINIVFLLLIFFMVVGRLSAADPFTITPVRSASDGAPAAQPWLVHVGAEGQLALNGVVLEERVLLSEVRAAAQSAGALDVRIKSDNATEAAFVVALLGRLRSAGVAEVRLMTVQPEK